MGVVVAPFCGDGVVAVVHGLLPGVVEGVVSWLLEVEGVVS